MYSVWAVLSLLCLALSFGSMAGFCFSVQSRVAGGERHLLVAGVLLAVSAVALLLA